MNVNLGPFLKIPYAVLFQQILTKRDQLKGKSVKPAAVFAQNYAYPEQALYSLNREFKKAQEALTSPLCNKSVKPAAVFAQNFDYPEHALYSLNREFKKAQEALTSPLCNRVLEI